MEWMIAPVGVDSFFDKSWEKRPLHIKRGKPEYYKNVFSTKAFDTILRGKLYLAVLPLNRVRM